MSLFDVIKYPFSNPPTDEELWGMPPFVYSMWRSVIYNYGETAEPPTEAHLKSLKKVIANYNGETREDFAKVFKKTIWEVGEDGRYKPRNDYI